MVFLLCLLGTLASSQAAAPIDGRPRLIVMTDIGHDPDDEQQIVHLLACANEVEIEGLIPSTGRFFRPKPTDSTKWLMPHLLHGIIDGYAAVYPNLQFHAAGWPDPARLHDIVANGQTGNGMSDVGPGRWSRGARLVTSAVLKPDPRPLHIVLNGGANTLAQSLFEYRAAHSTEDVAAFVSRLRVYDNQAQDEAGAWILHEFPAIHWIRGVDQPRAFGGPSNENLGPHVWAPYAYTPDGQDEWAHEHIRTNHGALGATLPTRRVGIIHFFGGGGTVPWLRLVSPGLSDLDDPASGGWSGRYSPGKKANVLSPFGVVRPDEQPYQPFHAYTDVDIVERWRDPAGGPEHDSPFAPVWRWRAAIWRDLQARMDWCVQPYEKANHHPHAVLNGDATHAILRVGAAVGDMLTFDATGSSDPDEDAIAYSWWFYPEAGLRPYGHPLPMDRPHDARVSVTVPADAAGRELHLILEVQDQNQIAPLTAYRRAVITVR